MARGPIGERRCPSQHKAPSCTQPTPRLRLCPLLRAHRRARDSRRWSAVRLPCVCSRPSQALKVAAAGRCCRDARTGIRQHRPSHRERAPSPSSGQAQSPPGTRRRRPRSTTRSGRPRGPGDAHASAAILERACGSKKIHRAGGTFVCRTCWLSACAYGPRARLRPTRAPCSVQAEP
jgi:hypothetical protein